MSASDDYIVTIVGSALATSLFLFPLAEEATQTIGHSANQVEKILLNLHGNKRAVANRQFDTKTLGSAFDEADAYSADGVKQGEVVRSQFLVEYESKIIEDDK
jgi:hypothetical protein